MSQGTLDFSQEPKNLNAEQQLVWDIIKSRPGRGNALSAGEIGSMAGFPDDIKSHHRMVRRIVRELVVDHYLNIGSSPSGFFMISSEDEMDDCYRSLRSMGLKILQKAARIKKVSLHKFLGQLSMEIEQEEEKKSEAAGGEVCKDCRYTCEGKPEYYHGETCEKHESVLNQNYLINI